jgi:hypothetical protein
MSPAEIRERLLELTLEREAAEAAGRDRHARSMADLEDEVTACRAAYVGAAVTEIAILRGNLSGRTFG